MPFIVSQTYTEGLFTQLFMAAHCPDQRISVAGTTRCFRLSAVAKPIQIKDRLGCSTASHLKSLGRSKTEAALSFSW